MQNIQRTFRVNSKIKINILSGNIEDIENTIVHLINTKQLKDGDKVTFGAKGIRVNHIPCRIEEGKLIYLNSFKKQYQKVEVRKKRKAQSNSYRIEGDVAIFTTDQKNPVEFIVDVENIDKVLEHKWAAHPCTHGIYVAHRYVDESGKWRVLSLFKHLGYSKAYMHSNNNVFDFRKDNIKLKKLRTQ